MRRLLIQLCLMGIVGNSIYAQNIMKRNNLTKEEQRVLIHKGTERAYTGKYTDHKQVGVYCCKWCESPLYRSESKFDSHCGWPSFDDELDGAVERRPDPDGSRMEIVCSNCGGHLGHVFTGEHFTETNTRHCVNSISLKFIAKEDDQHLETAIFAGGCFWGVEHLYKNTPGVLTIEVGYIGGNKANPSYEDICVRETGHAEAIRMTYDSSLIKFRELAKLFFEIHDPTQMNRQGPDMGDQYRSEIFYTNDSQKNISEELIQILIEKGYDVVTKVSKAAIFWTAESYHQDYYAKTGGAPYCHVYTKRF
ncbi:MAG: bifunctional methionine sulfoxide reductase B/A protein [Bacteroidetes bacterium]|nr:bifunctional methionine sulfoxide reductase B/A protein [Bacteroidota bacterium]